MLDKPYAFDPAWNERMLWFVDCGAGSRASFATTWDAARWISSNANVRNTTVVIHIPTGVGALLPAFVKARRPKTKRAEETETVYDKVETYKTDREAIVTALRFVLPPDAVEYL